MELIKAIAFQLDQPFLSLFRIALIYDLIAFLVLLLHVAAKHLYIHIIWFSFKILKIPEI
jgi:hypothetical protein